MKDLKSIELLQNKEERLPGFSSDFPYIATRAQIDEYDGLLVCRKYRNDDGMICGL